jgi:hemoglobin
MALTIYERNGGFPAIRKLIADFYEAVLDSPKIGHHFEEVDMQRLMDHQTRFIAFLMGGPTTGYSDDHLARVHGRRGITHEEFDEMVELLTEAMEDHDFSADDVASVQRELRKRESVIVTA